MSRVYGFDESQYARIVAMMRAFESGTFSPSDKRRTPPRLRELARVPFHNDSGETIPAWGVMRIADADRDDNDNWRITARKPNATFYNAYLVNGSTEVATSTDGTGSFLWHSGEVLCDDDFVPAQGEEWGPTSGSWALVRHRPGFLIDGGPTGSSTTYRAVAKQRVVTELVGKPNGDMTKGSAGPVTPWMRNASSGDYEDSGYDDLTAYPIGSDLSEVLFCSLRFDCGQWLVACLESE